jgi:hypothetical protein
MVINPMQSSSLEVATVTRNSTCDLLRSRLTSVLACENMSAARTSNAHTASQCCICLEQADAVALCVSCGAAKHALCATCLNGYVLSEISSNKKKLGEKYGFVKCPVPGCDSVGFSQYELSQHLSQGAFEAYMTAWRQCMEQQAAQTAAEQAQQQRDADAALDALARGRSHIINSILTLKCPRCGKAFDGFDGCFALSCSDDAGHGCGASFCAFCLQQSTWLHAHVLTCPHNSIPNGGVFADEAVFEAAQRARRQRLTHQYLHTLSPDLRGQVLAAVEQELQGIGIDVEALRTPAPVVTIADAGTAAPPLAAPLAAATAAAAAVVQAAVPRLLTASRKWLQQQQRDSMRASLDSAAFAAAEALQQGTESLCAELLERTSEPELAAAAYAELEQETRLHLAKLAAAQQKEAPLCAPRAAVWAAHERRLQQRLRRAQWQQRSIKQQQLLQQLTEVMTVLGTVIAVLLLLLYCVYPWVLAAAAQVELWFVSSLAAAAAQVKLFFVTNMADLLWSAVVGLAAVLLTVALKRQQ